MNLKHITAPILAALFLEGGVATASSHSTTTTPEGATHMTPTELVLAGFAALLTDFDVEALPGLFAEDFIQHNPGVPTGLASLMGILPAIEASGLRVTTHRVFADGDLVVLHSTYENAEVFGAPTLVGFDVFRVADGKIVEHWDNLQPPAAPNASGRTMTDGPTEVTDLDRTEANKALVAEFARTVLIEGDFARIADFIIGGEAYAQHNPLFGDGLTALAAAFEEFAEQGKGIRYVTVHQVLGEGNFVLMMAEGAFGTTSMAFYDLFRLEDGMIVEHWDVIAEIPAEMAHGNGMF